MTDIDNSLFFDGMPSLAAMDALEGWERSKALMAFARSQHFFSLTLLPIDELLAGVGASEDEIRAYRLVRRLGAEACGLLRNALREESPAKTWNDAVDHKDALACARDRRAIYRALKINPDDSIAFYATLPFRIIRPEGEKPWIAGAIGCPRIFTGRPGDWLHIDIHDIVLWNPRTGETRLAGETQPTLVECPDWEDGRYTVYTDGFAFFRAWADRRAQIGAAIKLAREAGAVVPLEPVDSGLPGTLAIGDLDRICWRDLNASVLVAGPGTDPHKLKRAIYRAARLPRVEAPSPMRVVA